MAEPVYLSGGRIQGRSDDSVLDSIPQTSWKELDRVTLSGTSDTMDTGTFTAKDNLMILAHIIRTGSVSVNMTFNADDSNGNYAGRLSETGESDGTDASQDEIRVSIDGEDDEFYVMNFSNIANQEKLGTIEIVARQAGTGAGNAPTRGERVEKWVNTSDQITRVTLSNPSGGDFASGSELVVLGCDNDEADSGTNYWQELAVKELSSTGDTIDSGTLTAKKYLKVAVSINATTAVRTQFQFNSDTGSNYANRNQKNGASDSTNPNMGRIYLNDLERSSDGYAVAYIINVADREKLLIYHDVWQNSTGASNIPDRTETVAKWANTSNQITSIQLLNDKAGDFASGSFIRIWGAD